MFIHESFTEKGYHCVPQMRMLGCGVADACDSKHSIFWPHDDEPSCLSAHTDVLMATAPSEELYQSEILTMYKNSALCSEEKHHKSTNANVAGLNKVLQLTPVLTQTVLRLQSNTQTTNAWLL